MSACVPSQNGLFADRRSGRASGGFARRTRSRRPKRRGCRLSARAVRYNSSPGLRRRRSIARVPVRPHRSCARRAAPTVPTDITPLRARRSRPRRRPQPQRRRSRCRRRYRRSARKRKVGRRRDAGCERRAACGFGPVEVLALMAPVAKRFLLGSAAPAQCVGRPRTTAFVRLDRREFERHRSTHEIRPVLDDDDRCVHYESELPTLTTRVRSRRDGRSRRRSRAFRTSRVRRNRAARRRSRRHRQVRR